MLLSAVSVLVVAQSSSKIPEGLMNNPVLAAATCRFRRQTRQTFLRKVGVSVTEHTTYSYASEESKLKFKVRTLRRPTQFISIYSTYITLEVILKHKRNTKHLFSSCLKENVAFLLCILILKWIYLKVTKFN